MNHSDGSCKLPVPHGLIVWYARELLSGQQKARGCVWAKGLGKSVPVVGGHAGHEGKEKGLL